MPPLASRRAPCTAAGRPGRETETIVHELYTDQRGLRRHLAGLAIALLGVLSAAACEVGSEEPLSPARELPDELGEGDTAYSIEDWSRTEWIYSGPACSTPGVYWSPCGFIPAGTTTKDYRLRWAYWVEVEVHDCTCEGEDLGHGPCWSYSTESYHWYICAYR